MLARLLALADSLKSSEEAYNCFSPEQADKNEVFKQAIRNQLQAKGKYE